MKHHYVKTSNHTRFMAGVAAVEGAGSQNIHMFTGVPGAGKSTTVDHWGSHADAIYLEGIPGMSIAFVRDYLADQTGVVAGSKFQQYKAMVEHFTRSRQPIILDEAQHGLPNKAEAIEYLRRIADQARVMLVLVCHTSEKHRFSEERLAHIASRIGAWTDLKPASVEDVAIYLGELCEVKCAADVPALVHTQSGGRYRLMANAGRTLEVVAGKLGRSELCAADLKGIRLCEDAMKSLSGREGK